ncbi:DUF1574 family protein [Leptospira haakeii]|uniref:DUF1574 domain-containing protein n=1 Tax=Leptospira haakeii TaxID=2023198 RepID=A0ABX4PHQ1_9LEPT|nr:DUF1574 family protein [Leptospira haakeii]PKA14445.1 hypothetical protein CH363_18790 [Leptospira haakeii]PKA18281.1 hypothetical protein CH377_18160 [Leptospira haakeii]
MRKIFFILSIPAFFVTLLLLDRLITSDPVIQFVRKQKTMQENSLDLIRLKLGELEEKDKKTAVFLGSSQSFYFSTLSDKENNWEPEAGVILGIQNGFALTAIDFFAEMAILDEILEAKRRPDFIAVEISPFLANESLQIFRWDSNIYEKSFLDTFSQDDLPITLRSKFRTGKFFNSLQYGVSFYNLATYSKRQNGFGIDPNAIQGVLEFALFSREEPDLKGKKAEEFFEEEYTKTGETQDHFGYYKNFRVWDGFYNILLKRIRKMEELGIKYVLWIPAIHPIHEKYVYKPQGVEEKFISNFKKRMKDSGDLIVFDARSFGKSCDSWADSVHLGSVCYKGLADSLYGAGK